MKTNPTPKIFKLSTVARLGIAIAAALVTQPMRASVINSIVITEKSSTNLAVTYTLADGTIEAVTVTFISSDDWTVRFPTTVTFNSGGGGISPFFGTGNTFSWVEPENSTLGNFVVLGAPSHNELTFTSDVVPPFPSSPNGTTVPDVGTDSSNGKIISATFHDNGDVAGVPDAGSAFDLLFLSLIALFGASRLRSLQLA